MNIEFYALPIALHSVPSGKTLTRCSLKQSIAHNLHLILTSTFNSLASDDQFGCRIWDADFDNISNQNKQKEEIIHSIQQVIARYERRLAQTRVELRLQQEEAEPRQAGTRVKKKLSIVITAHIQLTNEPIVYRDHFFVSPLSYDL